MEQKLASLFQIIAHAELEIDVIRASISKAVGSDFQKVFNLMDSATRDAVSSFELARFLEARKVPAEQDEVRLVIQHYDIQRKGKWDLDTLQKAMTPRSKGVQGAPSFGGQDANKELEAQLLKFFEKELDIIRAAHPIRVQLYEGGASPVTALYKLLKKEKSEDITIAELTSVLRGTGVQLSDAEKTAVIQRADKEGKNSMSYKEFEASILPDITRKKVMERKVVETTKLTVPTTQTTQVTQVTQMTKSLPDKYTKMAEASEHLEVSFRAPQSTFQPTTTPLLNTDNVLRKEVSAQETKSVSKTSQPFITSPYVSEYKAYSSTKNEKVPETPDKYTAQSQKYQPAKTIASYSNNTKEHNITPLDTTLTSKFSENPEKELTPSFFGPKTSITSYADQPKSYITPNPDLLHPTQTLKPADNVTLHQTSLSSSTLVKSGLIATENKDPMIRGQVFASLLQPFETAEPKVMFQSASKQREQKEQKAQKEVLPSQSFVSPIKSTPADTLSSSGVQQQSAPRLIKAKELYSNVTLLSKAPRETKYQNYEPSFASPSITRSSYQQSLYVTDRSFSLASKSSSSAFQTPVKEALPESMMGSSDKLQKALEMLGSPLRSPRYVRFNEISENFGLQSRKLF